MIRDGRSIGTFVIEDKLKPSDAPLETPSHNGPYLGHCKIRILPIGESGEEIRKLKYMPAKLRQLAMMDPVERKAKKKLAIEKRKERERNRERLRRDRTKVKREIIPQSGRG